MHVFSTDCIAIHLYAENVTGIVLIIRLLKIAERLRIAMSRRYNIKEVLPVGVDHQPCIIAAVRQLDLSAACRQLSGAATLIFISVTNIKNRYPVAVCKAAAARHFKCHRQCIKINGAVVTVSHIKNETESAVTSGNLNIGNTEINSRAECSLWFSLEEYRLFATGRSTRYRHS